MHGDLCPYYLDEGEVTAETMTFWSGGGTCTAWSQFGCGRQDSDETMIPLIVIIAQVLCYKKRFEMKQNRATLGIPENHCVLL